MPVEHPLAVSGGGFGAGEPDQVVAAILPALPVIQTAHDAVDLEHGVDLGRMVGVLGQTHDRQSNGILTRSGMRGSESRRQLSPPSSLR